MEATEFEAIRKQGGPVAKRSSALFRTVSVAVGSMVILMVSMVTGFGVAAASAATNTFGPIDHSFMNQAHNLCLDAAAQSDGTNGGKVQLWTCLGGANQDWVFQPVGAQPANGLWGELVNKAHGLCLDAAAQADGNSGDTVQLWQCIGGPNQLWFESEYNYVDSYSAGSGMITDGSLENQAAMDTYGGSLCLDAAAQTDATNGGKVQLWTCEGTETAYNQMWSTSEEVQNLAQGLCLDAAAQTDATNGGKVQLWNCVGDANQQWVLEIAGGNYRLVNLAHSLCLDAAAQTNGTDGGKVQLWACKAGDLNQDWWFNASNKTFQNQAHGLYLDAAAATAGQDGGAVQVWSGATLTCAFEWYLGPENLG